MTKAQVLELIGKLTEIREPLGGTESEREILKQNMGSEFFNSVDLEN